MAYMNQSDSFPLYFVFDEMCSEVKEGRRMLTLWLS